MAVREVRWVRLVVIGNKSKRGKASVEVREVMAVREVRLGIKMGKAGRYG